ncbi:hypothetical protein [Domibacillus mangrovi]|uniref:DUF1659 domain-containing protein n=1 Tax=Domibacillus mangrovi TaxID=1714354 RepID=A0A1Q5NZB4_9BACI|nr:hypothetical protein [Domibacillus mangrovi]OKL35329.1 hypothetical protein BLL40_15830 [Domibacillus mangrovi]
MQETLLKKSMVLFFDEGIIDGKDVIKRYTYANVDISGSAQGLHDTALALASLYKGTLAEVQTVATNAVSN